MTDFTRQRTVRTERPEVIVDPGLLPGPHRFELTTIDAAGRQSKPVVVTVVIEPSRSIGRRGTSPPLRRPG